MDKGILYLDIIRIYFSIICHRLGPDPQCQATSGILK
jgi:hypothetical protein